MAILDRPPPEWRRPSIPLYTQIELYKRFLAKLGVELELDHRPPLWERQFDDDRWDTIPPANDADYLEAIPVAEHRERTFGRGGEKRITTAGSDAHARAKTRRLTRPKVEKRSRWAKGRKIPSRKFQKHKEAAK
jgi:hypothetical protein